MDEEQEDKDSASAASGASSQRICGRTRNAGCGGEEVLMDIGGEEEEAVMRG